MSAELKGPRLWFRAGAKLADGTRADGYWTIKDDGDVRISTGVRSPRGGKPPQAAQDALARYILEKREIPRTRDSDAAEVKIADVLRLYMEDCAPQQAAPLNTIRRCETLMDFWGERTLADVSGRTCRDYADWRNKPAARRELEDFRAAIRYHRKEGLCRHIVEVTLPQRGAARDRWLTRSEAARLIWAAWRYREIQKGHATGRKSRQHIARFILVALYTGTRAGAVCAASLMPATNTGWIDLERGVFHRRAAGERETNKRKPPVRVPLRLLAHMRRWHANGQRFAVEWNGKPVTTGVEKAFKNAIIDANERLRTQRRGRGGRKTVEPITGNVTPHTLRHTAATWLMQRGTDLWEAAGYLGMTTETLEHTYGHHHPDFQSQAAENITRKA
jgi:integrase